MLGLTGFWGVVKIHTWAMGWPDIPGKVGKMFTGVPTVP